MTEIASGEFFNASDLDPATEILFNKAQVFYRNGQLDLAVAEYQNVLKAVPEHAESNYYLGVIAVQDLGATDALPFLEAAIKSKPDCEQFWIVYIETLSMVGSIEYVVNAIELGLSFGLKQETAGILAAKYYAQLDPTVNGNENRLLAITMPIKHKTLLAEKKRKSKIRVVFLVIHKSVWKLDSVFQAMIKDSFFEPIILICPYISFGEEAMQAELDSAYRYFQKKGYPVISAYDKEVNDWIKLKDLAVDLIFFTNPHSLTRSEYYDTAYKNYLSCYVPYDHQVSNYADNQPQYNQNFHNAIWRIFVPHTQSLDIFRSTSETHGENVVVTGYPACEVFVKAVDIRSAWKVQDKNKLKFIWAPHHTIDMPELPYSNFLKYAYFFQQLAQQYAEKIQWAFKPHPILRSKLNIHADWGPEKTDRYYAFWENQSNTQFEDGEYQDLFIESDAMIHDCGSFLAEYLYLRKPVLYLVSDANITNYFNAFGREAFDACQHAHSEEDVVKFIESSSEASMVKIDAFYESNIKPYFVDDLPSAKIIANIKQGFSH